MNEYARLARVMVHSASVAFTPERVEQQWRALNFTAPPDVERARDEYAGFVALLRTCGSEIEELPDAPDLTLDAVYVRDAAVATPRGMVLCRMGKHARRFEPAAQRHVFEQLGVPIIGVIEAPGLLEGGDVAWLDDRTVVVGQGYRTNAEGIRQLKELVGGGVDVVVAHLPHYRGEGDVFHLMSVFSPVDERLAVVYSPLMPVPLRQYLIEREIELIEVPQEEYDALGTNVLAMAPRRCVMADGAPTTRARLEAAGAEVSVYSGVEISLKGGGGPTCLTRPIERRATGTEPPKG
jgi:N-dimethylarginine dimethylaminohydrolase